MKSVIKIWVEYAKQPIEYTASIFENTVARYVQADESYLRETKKGDYGIWERLALLLQL